MVDGAAAGVSDLAEMIGGIVGVLGGEGMAVAIGVDGGLGLGTVLWCAMA